MNTGALCTVAILKVVIAQAFPLFAFAALLKET
jgi:hypothetical protein